MHMTNKNYLHDDIQDSPEDQEKLKPEETTLDLPELKDIPGASRSLKNASLLPGDTTISSSDEEADDLLDDDDDELDGELDVTPASKKKEGKVAASAKKGKDEDDDDDNDSVEEVDEWDKVEEDEEWDPDFDEFDIPKSKGKKTGTTSKKGADEEEEFKVDDEFKDMFNDGDDFEEEDDDY